MQATNEQLLHLSISMMSTMTNKLLVLALGASLMSGCASQPPAPVDTTADQAALKEITVTWFNAYNGATPTQPQGCMRRMRC